MLVDPRIQIVHTSQNEFSPHPVLATGVLAMQAHLFLNTGIFIFSSRPVSSLEFVFVFWKLKAP